jgi:hypothetical protein
LRITPPSRRQIAHHKVARMLYLCAIVTSVNRKTPGDYCRRYAVGVQVGTGPVAFLPQRRQAAPQSARPQRLTPPRPARRGRRPAARTGPPDPRPGRFAAGGRIAHQQASPPDYGLSFPPVNGVGLPAGCFDPPAREEARRSRAAETHPLPRWEEAASPLTDGQTACTTDPSPSRHSPPGRSRFLPGRPNWP